MAGFRHSIRATQPCWFAGALCAVLLMAPGWAGAQGGSTATSSSPADSGPAWASLTVDQQRALAPLKAHWSSTDANGKAKWLVVAQRFSSMPPEKRELMQTRMAEWARMSPQQRGHARLRFQGVKELAPAQRKEQWAQYQALSPEQRQALQSKAALARPQRTSEAPANTLNVARMPAARPAAGSGPLPHSSAILVPPRSAALAARTPAPKVVSPVDVQASPGATTTLLNRSAAIPQRPMNSLAQRQGIMALPANVDRRTLLPTPQGPTQRLTQVQRPPASAAGGTAKQ